MKIYIADGWIASTFLANFHFGVNYFFKTALQNFILSIVIRIWK